jgi:hypothetical protein
MKKLFENWQKFVDEGVEVRDKPYRTDADAKKDVLGSMYQEATTMPLDDPPPSELEKIIRKALEDEGGAAGLEPIEKALAKQKLDLPDNFDLKDFLAGRGPVVQSQIAVGQHQNGDYILGDSDYGGKIKILRWRPPRPRTRRSTVTKELKQDLQEGIEIFLEAQEEVLDEKRKRKKKKKKKKSKKDACYHKVRARYKVWPSAYASGALVKCRKKGAKNWGTGGKKKRKNESLSLEDMIREEIQNVLDEACWSGYTQKGMKKKGNRMVPNCVPLEENELEEKKKRKKKRKLTAKPSSETSLRDWFGRKGAKGKKKGWVDCNTCRKDKKTGRKTCSACGRSTGEKRAKYPSCRPTPGACGKRGKHGKKSKAGKKG